MKEDDAPKTCACALGEYVSEAGASANCLLCDAKYYCPEGSTDSKGGTPDDGTAKLCVAAG